MKNFCILLLSLFAWPLLAQNTMCGNGDFESGQIDPSEWTGYYNPGSCNCGPKTFTVGILSGPMASSSAHQTIVDHSATPTDPNIPALSTTPPFPISNRYSLRIGNSANGCGIEKVAKSFTVQANNPVMTFWYASVMQNPGSNHDCVYLSNDLGQVPGFGVNLFDQLSNDISNLVDLGDGANFNYFNAGNPFFTQASNNPSLFYTDWDCVSIDLSNYINQTVTIEFYNRDCLAGAHFGYSYIDDICLGCSGARSGSIDLDQVKTDTCGLPGQICINYTLPNTGNLTGDCQLDLTIFQNGIPLTVLSSPVLTSGNQYCFALNTTNLSMLNNGLGGFDFQATGHFSITDALNNTTILPDKTIGAAPDGAQQGPNNDYPIACPNVCDQLIVSDSMLTSGQCCYAIDLFNGMVNNIAYVEANILGSDWVFSAGATLGAGYGWFGTPGPTSLPFAVISPSGGNPQIPGGFSNDALAFCLEPTQAGVAAGQTVVFTWYAAQTGVPGFTPICQDTLLFDCSSDLDIKCLTFQGSANCNPDDPYEYTVTFTVTNNSSFTATAVALDNLVNPVDFGFSACTASDHLASILIPIPSGLNPGATSAPLCVKISALNPVLSPTMVQFFASLISPTQCCSNETQVELTLAPCCEPCADIRLTPSPLQTSADVPCCYSLDLENSCAYRFFNKIETSILTPGVQFGYHALGGPNAPDWNIGASTPTSILWEMNGANFIPKGNTMDLIQFCLDDIDQPSETPQFILVNWITPGADGRDSIACSDTLRFSCAPVIDYQCLNISNTEIVCGADTGSYCYTFTVTNTSDIPFAATNLDLFEVSGAAIEFTGAGGTFPLPPLNQGDSIRLTVCFVADTVPLTDSTVVFQFRLRYLMGDTCCYESTRDTLSLPDCSMDTTNMHDCCSPSMIQLPTGFSPNGDGINDLYEVRDQGKCREVTLTVYNRWGNVVYQKDNYDNSWDGAGQNGNPLPQGTYYILLTLHDIGSSMSTFVDLRRL